ncbi:MAG: bifunctional diguanylate cyclase/phosphodiesterase, partial [Acholeplasmataceae bacterium]|nr:bifunctional diguanylate cyclase/phosphodiesterase [Acholeplasmataceae bacterium]
MKRYTWKLAIAFTISYVIMMVVVIFAYTQISANFITRQATTNLSHAGETLIKRIDAELTFDYELFETEVNALILADENTVIDNLYDQIDTLNASNIPFTGFGEIVDRSLILPDQTLVYHIDLDEEDFIQNVAFYSFDDAFRNGDEQAYIFFHVSGFVGYFDASLYLNQIFEYLDLDSYPVIIGHEGTVYYQPQREGSQKQFFNYLRAANVSQDVISDTLNTLNFNRETSITADFFNVKSIYVFNPYQTTLSTLNLYVVNIFSFDDVMSSMSYLTNILWAFFVVIFVLFAGAMVLLFKILETKINDIEDARMTHYYAKPYIIRINVKGKIKSYNRSFKRLLGDYDIYDYVTDFKIKQEFNNSIIEEVLKKQLSFTAIFDIGLSNGIYIHFIPVKTTGGYILIGDDITNIEGRFDEYRNLALYNKVTHLPNMNSLKQDLQELFDNKELLARHNSIIAFDIVSFSKINILLGEKSGDRFLVIIAELAKQSLEGYPATLYNINADHFIVFFKDIENLNWVTRWIDKIGQTFEKPITIDKNFINVEVKVGVFHIEAERYEILNPDVCYDNMMLALNHAKESAQRRDFTYDVSLSLIASRDQKMEFDLANAIKNQEFRMALQPQFDNEKEKIVGFEALIRWSNPKYASESPLKFIQMAEKNNMIIDIGRIALHETFQIAKELEPYDVHISVNISPVQMLQAGFVNEVIAIFEQYELKKGSISLEITETFLIGSFDLVITKLKILQKYGFGIHLDDFGTGYSSLQYLRDLPINTIKIDRAFVINLETDAHSRAIVNMISNLAKNIGLMVVAEGIETDKQNQIAFKNGCNLIQGYLISPPVFKNDAIKLINDYNINKTKTVDLQKTPKEK